jgi:hypothetical protein
MPHMMHPPAPAGMDAQHDRTARYPTTVALVPPRQRWAILRHLLRLLRTSDTRHLGAERSWRSPDPTPGEPLTTTLARQHPRLYIDCLQR